MGLVDAFGLSPDRSAGQRKSFMAVARRIEKLPDRDEIAAQFIALAREKCDAGMANPCAAWQKAVDDAGVVGAEC